VVLRRIIVIVSLVGLAACSNGGDSDSGALTTSERKYCTMVKQFKDRMPTVPKDADPEQFIAQMSESMRKNNDYFNDLLKVAPTEIKADVEKAIAALQRVAGGDITAYDGLDLTKADEWEEAHCNR
jgi:O6-methylguanine-DNA--protein-cysteine methyltransferase